MSSNILFDQAKDRYLKTLQQYVPVVARVHGGNHPEFHEIRAVFDVLVEKIQQSETDNVQLDQEFSKLREISHNYLVPEDVCESYEAVYRMLEEIDEAYRR
jgi:regulator of cell morphogenesis and NO signaling